MKVIKYQPSSLSGAEININHRLKNLSEQYSLIVLSHNKSYLTEAMTVRFYSTNTKTSCVVWNNLYHANSSAKVINTKSENPKLDTLITALAKIAVEFDGKRAESLRAGNPLMEATQADAIEDYLNTIANHEGFKTYMIIRANA